MLAKMNMGDILWKREEDIKNTSIGLFVGVFQYHIEYFSRFSPWIMGNYWKFGMTIMNLTKLCFNFALAGDVREVRRQRD